MCELIIASMRCVNGFFVLFHFHFNLIFFFDASVTIMILYITILPASIARIIRQRIQPTVLLLVPAGSFNPMHHILPNNGPRGENATQYTSSQLPH